MDFTGERFVPLKELMDDEIAFEHLHRYHISCDVVKNKVVLDIACGEGYGTAILATKASKVFGVDIDKESIENAKRTYKKDNIEFLEGNVTKIPIPDNSVDVIISYETIEHISEDLQKEFLTEIKRVLKRDGFLIISTPDKENYTERYSYKNEFHVKEFRRDEFPPFLEKYFENVTTYFQGYEIVSAITKEKVSVVEKLSVVDWHRAKKPFIRKYILAVCSDIEFYDKDALSSLVFQVDKNYWEIMDLAIKNEAHIQELGNWGRSLDNEIQQKDKYIGSLQKEMEIEKIANSSLREELRNTFLFKLEEQKTIIKEKTENEQNLYNQVNEAKTIIQKQEENEQNLYNQVNEAKTIIQKQEENERSLYNQVNEAKTIIQKQEENERNLYDKIGGLNEKLSKIYESDGWQLLKKYYNLKGWLLHEDSKRYKLLKKLVNNVRGKNKKQATIKKGRAIAKNLQPKVENDNSKQKQFDIITFEKFENPVVSIIIPVFNGWEVTYECLKSIHINTISTHFEIIIADDGATDETKNINQYIQNVVVIRNEKNLGFLHNCNNATKKAKGKYIAFLNNDTLVKPAWLSSMTNLIERDQKIGMVGSKLIYPNGKLQEAGGIIWSDASGWNFGHNQDPEASQFNYVKEVDYISGASIIIRAELWYQIGGFDTRYAPAYCEDSDLAFEVRKRGFKVVYQPLSEVIHYEGYSHGVDAQQGTIKEYQKINNLKLKEKWNAVLQKEHFPNGENVFFARDRSQHKKTILVVDHYVPHFDKDAGSKTVFQYLSLFVSMNLNVKFIGDNFCRHEPYTTTLQQMGIEVLYGSWYAENWKQWIKDNHDKLDYILLNRPHITIKYIDFVRENTKAKILYYGHDLHFAREMKRYEVEKDPALLKSSQKWKDTETDIFRKSDVVLAPSIEESEQIKSLGIETVAPIKPYIFTERPVPFNDFSNKKDILFIGGFGHLPNVDAVLWFVKEIWPVIKLTNPEIKFIIVGSNPPETIKGLANDRIEVTGYVSDEELNRLYNRIKTVVIPLRYGAGVKGKTVEAMYKGIPITTTTFGIEGLPGISSFISAKDNAEEFANEVIRVYNLSNEKLVEMSRKETDYISSSFMFENVKRELIDIFDKLDR